MQFTTKKLNFYQIILINCITTTIICVIFYAAKLSSTTYEDSYEMRSEQMIIAGGKEAGNLNKKTRSVPRAPHKLDNNLRPDNRSSILSLFSTTVAPQLTTQSPITVFHYKFDLVEKLEDKCFDPVDEKLDVVFLITSFILKLDFRNAIRQTWGREDRFRIRHVFFMGMDPKNDTVRVEILKENEKYKDIVLADYVDTYQNNSIKCVMAIDWARRYCSNSKFYIIADDDSYYNVKNLLKYLYTVIVPTNVIPQYEALYPNFNNEDLTTMYAKRKIRFFGGVVMDQPAQRSGKVAISKEEYPYDRYPPFVNGHCMVMSRDVIDELLEAAHHTKFIWLDDVYFGFLAHWANIPITNIPGITNLHPQEVNENTFDNYVSTHYMPTPSDMLRIWRIQEKKGNA